MKLKVTFSILLSLCSMLLIAEDKFNIGNSKFAHEFYKIKPNPNAEFITLENGFRIILLKNTFPEKKVCVSLYAGVGSLDENDKE